MDLETIANALLKAKRRADGLPYHVVFEPDEAGVVTVRGVDAKGLWVNTASTGIPFLAFLTAPDQEIDRALGFLDGCFRERVAA